jgi:hypothetical protein
MTKRLSDQETIDAVGEANLAALAAHKKRQASQAELEHKRQLDAVYDERNRLVAALARFALNEGRESPQINAWLGYHVADPRERVEEWDPEWRNVVYVQLPTGQCSWHIHDRDLPLFDFLERRTAPWDGHSTAEKYERIRRFAKGGL